ncbi:MAG: Omp28-related outer membrane protein [Bacteroidota bacterium]|nr:Omp28-related outer membrane protein [Bacteroidota bacterium]
MQKNLPFIVLVCFLINLNDVSAQAPRKVLVEQFTNASCAPCAASNPAFHAMLNTFGDNVVLLKYQCSFPGVDPMNSQTGAEVAGRYNAYYPAVPTQGIPYCALDGNKYNGHIALLPSATVANRLGATSPLEITVTHSLALVPKKDTISVTISVKNISTNDLAANTFILFAAITEKLVKFPSAPGTNGEFEFQSVMRKMLPNQNGTSLTDGLKAGESKDVTFKLAVQTYIYAYGQLGVVAFVQNKTTKEVLQAEESLPISLTGQYIDIEAVMNIKNKQDQCDNIISNEIIITNHSTTGDTIKTIDFVPVVNRANRTKQTWNGSLLPGETATVTFNNINLPIGVATYNIFIDKINGGSLKDINNTNNFGPQLRFLSFNRTPSIKSLSKDFEVVPPAVPPGVYYDNPAGFRIFAANKSSTNNPPFEVGGFGQSATNLFIDFNTAAVGSSASVYFEKVELTDSKNTKLAFSYAFAQKSSTNTDQMIIEVSPDCGGSWSQVFNKEGADLATVTNLDPSTWHIPTFWLPEPHQWKRDTISLTNYDFMPELLLRFSFRGGGGWSLWLDDVNISSHPAVGTNDPGVITSFHVFPNPTKDQLILNLNMAEAAKAQISLKDLNGKSVAFLAANVDLQAGFNQLDYHTQQLPGIYQLEVKTGKGIRIQKLVIE